MTILLRLAGYGLRHKLSLAGGYAALVLYSLTFMLIPRLLGTAIDEAVTSGLRSRLLLLALAIVGIGVLSALFGYLKEYLLEMVHHRVAFDLRNDFYKKVQSLSFGFHDRQQTGDLMSRATSDVDAVKQLSWSFAHAAYLAAFVSGVIVLMLLMNWKLGLVCGAFAAVALWRSFAVIPTMVRTWHAAQDEIGQMTRVVQEALVGMRVVKGFASARFEQRKFAASASSVRELLTVAGLISNSRKALSGLIVNAAIVTVLWIGAREVAAERLSAGDAAAFVLYMGVLGDKSSGPGSWSPRSREAWRRGGGSSRSSTRSRRWRSETTQWSCPGPAATSGSRTSLSPTARTRRPFTASTSRRGPGSWSRCWALPAPARAPSCTWCRGFTTPPAGESFSTAST